MTHYDNWHGALHTLSVLSNQKTIKTACGKRVAFSAIIDRGVCECEGCREHVSESITSALWLADQPYGSAESRQAVRDAAVKMARQFEIELPS